MIRKLGFVGMRHRDCFVPRNDGYRKRMIDNKKLTTDN